MLNTEIYNGETEGLFTRDRLGRFITEELDASLVTTGSWKAGSRKTPLEVYRIKNLAVINCKWSDYTHNRKTVVEATGSEILIVNVASLLLLRHESYLEQDLYHEEAILEDNHRARISSGIVPMMPI